MLAVTAATSLAASSGGTAFEPAPQYQSGGLLDSTPRTRFLNAWHSGVSLDAASSGLRVLVSRPMKRWRLISVLAPPCSNRVDPSARRTRPVWQLAQVRVM